jgi:hypothetical protein
MVMNNTPSRNNLQADVDPVQISSLLYLNNSIAAINNSSVKQSPNPSLGSGNPLIKGRR